MTSSPNPSYYPSKQLSTVFFVTQKRDREQQDGGPLRKLAQGFAAVTEVFVSSASGYLLGLFLDYWIVKTDPWMKVVFTLLGLIVGFYRLYKIYSSD